MKCRAALLETKLIHDHKLLRLINAGTALVTLQTGTAETLYPIANAINGEPAVPFRSASSPIAILIDLGSSLAVRSIYLLNTNLERISIATDIKLEAGVVAGIYTYSETLTLFPGDESNADFYGYAARYSARFNPAGTYRFWRITLTQGDRAADFTQVGEIFFDFDDDSDFPWLAEPSFLDVTINGARVAAEQSSNSVEIGINATISQPMRFVGNQLKSMLEIVFRREPLEPIELGRNTFGRISGFSASIDFVDLGNGTLTLRETVKDFDGSGGAY